MDPFFIMTVAIDFDNTMVHDKFPEIGEPVQGSIETMRWMIDNGVKIILYTIRSHQQKVINGKLIPRKSGDQNPSILQDAISWCENHGIKLYGVNRNPSQIWSNSRKVYADYYIDDKSLGIALNSDGSVNWMEIRKLIQDKILNP